MTPSSALKVGFESHEARAIRRHEQHDGCGVEEGACGVDGVLEVFCQSPISPNPGKEPLDDPAPRVNGEADLVGILRTISTAINVAVVTFSPAYPPSAKTRWMKGSCAVKLAEAVRDHRGLGCSPDAVRARGLARPCRRA